jgi:hypothetical protein
LKTSISLLTCNTEELASCTGCLYSLKSFNSKASNVFFLQKLPKTSDVEINKNNSANH